MPPRMQNVVAEASFKTIPNDCISLIIMFVTVDDQNAFSLVCKNVRQIWLQTSHGKLYQSIVNLHNTLQHSSNTLDLPIFAKYSKSISKYSKLYAAKEAKQYLFNRLEFLKQKYRDFAKEMIQELEDVKVAYDTAVHSVEETTFTCHIKIELYLTTIEKVECSIEKCLILGRLQNLYIHSSLHTKWEEFSHTKSLIKTFTFFMNQLYVLYEAQGKFGNHFDAKRFFNGQEAVFCIDDDMEWGWIEH